MSTARYIVGDSLEVLASLEPGSVDLVVSSPPFLALRSYLPADHVDKAREIGSEATPGEFLDVMLDVVEACARVLAPHGSLVFELGDTYAGGGGGPGAMTNVWEHAPRPEMNGKTKLMRANPGAWPLDKSKVLVPQLFAIALAYGFNPLTGRTTEPWRVRNTVAWCRPNPPVGRDGDKFRPATSFLTVACKARDRYWDGDAVRVPHAEHTLKYDGGTRPHTGERGGQGTVKEMAESAPVNPAGAPLLDWWNIPTAPYAGSHYATYPPNLVVPVIKAMCPERVCRECGNPSTRILQMSERYREIRERVGDFNTYRGENDRGTGNNGGSRAGQLGAMTASEYDTVGWSDCGHDNYRPGHVLDPFGGSGTTALVATGHGRDCTLIDIDARNAELAVERIGGLFVTVEHFSAPTGPQEPTSIANPRFREGYLRNDGRVTPQRKAYGA